LAQAFSAHSTVQLVPKQVMSVAQEPAPVHESVLLAAKVLTCGQL
jgi:hypothetical protein